MHHYKVCESGFKRLAAAIALATLFCSCLQASELGKLTVLSFLDQPLDAEIELITESDEDAITAKLASLEVYRLANIELNPALRSLQFSITRQQGRHLIRVISEQPLHSPFVLLYLDLTSNKGHAVHGVNLWLEAAKRPPTESKPPDRPVSGPASDRIAPSLSSTGKPVIHPEHVSHINAGHTNHTGQIECKVKPSQRFSTAQIKRCNAVARENKEIAAHIDDLEKKVSGLKTAITAPPETAQKAAAILPGPVIDEVSKKSSQKLAEKKLADANQQKLILLVVAGLLVVALVAFVIYMLKRKKIKLLTNLRAFFSKKGKFLMHLMRKRLKKNPLENNDPVEPKLES